MRSAAPFTWFVLTCFTVGAAAELAAPKAIIVTFSDANLEAVVRSSLKKPSGDIYDTDMTALTHLAAFDKDIADVSGLEYAVNLRVLSIHGGSISDLSPLSDLTNLTLLALTSHSISDLGPISGLTHLTNLRVLSNSIIDVSPIVGLMNLAFLSLADNGISDISPLSGLTDLTLLELSVNNISDISPLSGLTNLIDLVLWQNHVSDLSPLSELTNLAFLYLADNDISDLSPLSELTNLTYLNLSRNDISDVSPISGLTNLPRLFLHGNSITDVSPLSSVTGLTELLLERNAIRDIAPIKDLTNLAVLGLGRNSVCDISSLVAGPCLGAGDLVSLSENPLSQGACCEDIPALRARGVTVHYFYYSTLCHGGYSLGEAEPDAIAHDFAAWSINAGPTPAWTLTLSNTGRETLTVFGMSLGGPDSGEFVILSATDECYIRPGEEIEVEVVFDPENAGDSAATIRILSDDLDEPVIDVALAGTGQAPGLLLTTAIGQVTLLVMLGGLALLCLSRNLGREVGAG